VLIDRTKGAQSVKDIMMLGKHIEATNYSASIFPEGTRTKNGLVKTFQPAGIASLVRTAPSAVIIPFAIDGFEIMKNGYFPLSVGCRLKLTALELIEPKGIDTAELTQNIENLIKKELGQI
jgi:1-acyl-sn-glycerol-3-phosphate acyltransferase